MSRDSEHSFDLARRSTFTCFRIQDSVSINLSKILSGSLELESRPTIEALNPTTGHCYELSQEHLWLLSKIPEQWTSLDSLDLEPSDGGRLVELAAEGLFLTNSSEPHLVALRDAEEKLAASNWHPYAAWYHFMTAADEVRARQGDAPIDIRRDAELQQENSDRFVEKHGLPPAAYEPRETCGPSLELPLQEPSDPLLRLLVSRRTTRSFDTDRPLPLESFSTLLRYTFGCHGIRKYSNGLTLLHKSSPSGGSLHPLDTYVLATSVEGIGIGLYHYDCLQHSLEPIHYLEEAEARELAASFCNDQSFAQEAHALFVLTARWGRNFWKYRRRSRSFGVILTDAGHLSQTFYLLATQLELGAFYTGAIHAERLRSSLGLDPMLESPIGICGCGLKVAGGDDLAMDFEDFEPRRLRSPDQ